MEKIKEHDIASPEFEKYLFHKSEYPPAGYQGCLGFPSAATAEKGQQLTQRLLDKMLSDYKKICQMLL